MPGKRVDLAAAARNPEGRQVIWEAIRARAARRGRFRVADIEEVTRISEGAIRHYLRGLHAAGYLRRVDDEAPAGQYRAAQWELARDVGVEAPRVRADGTTVTEGRGREQLWRTMRIVGEFSPRELAVQASTEAHAVCDGEAKRYCKYLHLAGYLVPTTGGSRGRPVRYRMLPSRYSGPQAPMIQRVRQVFDPNTRRVVWRPDGGES